MARGIAIPFTLNPRDFLKGLRRVEVGLDDVVDELEKVERAGDDAFDEVADDAQDATRDAARAFERLADDVRDEYRRMERQADDVDIVPDVRTGARSARRAAGILAGEVFDEFIESWGEAVRTGDYGDAIRETFSNLGQIGGVFGPVGAAGGAVASFFLTNIYDQLADPESKERVARLAADAFEDADEQIGDKGFAAGMEFARKLREGAVAGRAEGEDLANVLDVDSVEDAWNRVAEIVNITGLDVDTVADAILGNRDAVREVEAAQADVLAQYPGLNAEALALGLRGREALAYVQERKRELGNESNVLGEVLGLAGDVAAANEEAAVAAETQARYHADAARGLEDNFYWADQTSGAIDGISAPDLLPMANNLANAARDAERANAAVNSIPTQRTVNVDIVGLTNKRLPI